MGGGDGCDDGSGDGGLMVIVKMEVGLNAIFATFSSMM